MANNDKPLGRPIEKRYDYVQELQRIKRFREAFAADEKKIELRAPVLSAIDIILNMMLLDHDPSAAWNAAELPIRSLLEAQARRAKQKTTNE